MLQYLVPSQTQRNLDVHNARYSRNYQAPVALGVLGTDVSNAGCRLLLSRAGGPPALIESRRRLHTGAGLVVASGNRRCKDLPCNDFSTQAAAAACRGLPSA